MRVLLRLSRLCVTSESPSRANQSLCLLAAQNTDKGQPGQTGVVREGGHGPLDQMEAVKFIAASDLIRAHQTAKNVRRQCGHVKHTDTGVRLS